jgi:hypothetical protein
LIVPCICACVDKGVALGTCTPWAVNLGTISPCLGPRPCLRASWSAFRSVCSICWPSTVEASSEGVAALDASGGDMGWSGGVMRCD